ncbi:hypothetical protein BSK59_16185 [Paenibacillus odorifer]|uniref:hypothetical protein n=1 Tax=Paenibacillus odorifer TaxID=189426 RepID=UPI00096CBB1A|nr:hypothetical protein [Paenibacillus odorifer]OME54118.1 hypothetical protein BSK59_16185 [Paenibacillus odorifer]
MKPTLAQMKPYWDFIQEINIELKNGMSFKRSGNSIDVAIYEWVGEEKINEVYQRFIDFGFKARKYKYYETYRIILTIEGE